MSAEPLDLTPIRALRFNVEEAMRFYGMSIKRRRAIDVGLHAVDALLAEVEALRAENARLQEQRPVPREESNP